MIDTIVEQAAEGLYHMHEKGWIHRDIKPDNYLVSRSGETKLIDFTIAERKKTGLGKLFHRNAKTTAGTRSYMSPEQIQGKLCDERSDIYSFGCVLFEAVTGKPPYTGSNPNELLTKHLTASIPTPLVYNDNVTPEFAMMTKKMMSKKPEQRYNSLWEFLKEYRTIQFLKRNLSRQRSACSTKCRRSSRLMTCLKNSNRQVQPLGQPRLVNSLDRCQSDGFRLRTRFRKTHF